MSGSTPAAEQLAALKTAWRMLVRRMGGVDPAGAVVGAQRSHVSEWGAGTSERYVSVDRVLRAEMDSGEPLLTAALAAAQGYRLERMDAASDASVGPLAARVAQEVGEAFGALATAQADGVITPSERDVLLREFAHVSAAANRVVAALRGKGDVE